MTSALFRDGPRDASPSAIGVPEGASKLPERHLSHSCAEVTANECLSNILRNVRRLKLAPSRLDVLSSGRAAWRTCRYSANSGGLVSIHPAAE
jgi:hypothetical protein